MSPTSSPLLKHTRRVLNTNSYCAQLISSDRRGDAQKVSNMVRARHEEIQKIERDFIELAQMFQDLDALVVQQDAAVERIDVAAEGVREDVGKGRTEIETAIKSARARNRKKWWCLGISSMHQISSFQPASSVLTLFSSSHPHHHCGCDRCCCCSHPGLDSPQILFPG